MRLGNFSWEHPAFLAPMAGVTDLPFRLLCKEQGCDVMCTEMVSAKALYYKSKNTRALLLTEPEEHPIAVQLFGSDPELMAEMAAQLEEDFDFIDVNMGCPVPKVVNNGEGSALMKDPPLVSRIVEAMARRLKKPVTVKIRAGFDDSSRNAVEIARRIEAAGGAAVAVHGRTREQYYSGRADWEMIRQVKDAVSIPVIGNGDIFSGEDAVRMVRETGCDGVMAARGAKGNPWLFREIQAALSGASIPARPSAGEIRDMVLRHSRLLVQYKGEYTAMREMRKHLAWYTAGFPRSSALRGRANQVETMEDLLALLREFFPENGED